MYSFPNLEPVCCSMSSSNCCFLTFHTVHGVLKARILRWFAIPFSNGPHFVRTFHHGPCVLGRTLERICSSFELQPGLSPAKAIHLLGSACLNTMPSWWSSLSSFREQGRWRSPLLWSAGFFPFLDHVWTVWGSLKPMQNFMIENYGWKYLFFILWSPIQRIVVQLLSHVWPFVTPGPPCPSLSAGVCSNSCPLNWWFYPII